MNNIYIAFVRKNDIKEIGEIVFPFYLDFHDIKLITDDIKDENIDLIFFEDTHENSMPDEYNLFWKIMNLLELKKCKFIFHTNSKWSINSFFDTDNNIIDGYECHNKLLKELSPLPFIFQSHSPSHFYCDELPILLESHLNKDKQKYDDALLRLSKRFDDPVLENKLNIYHHYLLKNSETPPIVLELNKAAVEAYNTDYTSSNYKRKLKELHHNLFRK